VLKGLLSELLASCDNKEKVFILLWAQTDRIKFDAIDTPDDLPSGMSKLNKFIP
jgi:hypothetical protein